MRRSRRWLTVFEIDLMIHTLLDACQFVLEAQGEPQSSFWLASQAVEMELWKTTEEKVRKAVKQDLKRFGESSRFVELPSGEFGLRCWTANGPDKAGMTRKRSLPRTNAQWLGELRIAIADAREAEPFGRAIGTPISDANLFHLAPLVCLKFRGKKLKGPKAERVMKVALANYVVNSDPEGVDHQLQQQPMMAFALCYVAARLAIDLVTEEQVEEILIYCEKHLD